MKKGIRISAINGVAKKAALGAMLASSVAMFASNPIKTARTDNPPQTEVVSKDGAEALKVMTFPQQQTPAVPTVHNKALDEKFLKLARDAEEKRLMEDFLFNVYKNCGSYLASAKIQQELDLNMFYEFLDGNIEILKVFDEEAYNKIDKDAMKKVVEKSEPIKKWLDENYFNVYNEPFGQFDNPPDAFEVENSLFEYIKKDPYKLFDNSASVLDVKAEAFAEKLNNSQANLVQKSSNLLAYEISTADYLLFHTLLKNSGIFKGYDDLDVIINFQRYMFAVQPTAD